MSNPASEKIVLLQKHQDTMAWGVDGPLAQRPMTSGSESQVDLEAARPNGHTWVELQQLAQDCDDWRVLTGVDDELFSDAFQIASFNFYLTIF